MSKNGVESCYLWWELYPADYVTVKRYPVHPGDSITLTVFHDEGGSVMMCAFNNTTSQSFWIIQPNTYGAEFSSAEWMVETFYPFVPRFGTIQWSNCWAKRQRQSRPILRQREHEDNHRGRNGGWPV